MARITVLNRNNILTMQEDLLKIMEVCFIYSLSTTQAKFVVWRLYHKKSHTEIAKLESKPRQYVTYHLTKAYEKLGSLGLL